VGEKAVDGEASRKRDLSQDGASRNPDGVCSADGRRDDGDQTTGCGEP
jgi:hypothetical protein